jgi:hypothetical protein
MLRQLPAQVHQNGWSKTLCRENGECGSELSMQRMADERGLDERRSFGWRSKETGIYESSTTLKNKRIKE